MLYDCEFWLPFMLPTKCFESKNNLLKFWEKLGAEVLNQKVCRMILSVHKRTSRLAVLGELGRYPIFIPALKLCLKYESQLSRSDPNIMINWAWLEIKELPLIDTYYKRVS